MIVVAGNSDDNIGKSIGIWYAKQTNKPLCGPFGALGFLDKDGNIGGAAIFTNYNQANIEFHIYGPGYLTRFSITKVLNYVFNELRCIRLTAIEKRSNKKMLKIVNKMGFVYEAVLKQYFGPDKQDDGIIFRMTSKEASKWIKING